MSNKTTLADVLNREISFFDGAAERKIVAAEGGRKNTTVTAGKFYSPQNNSSYPDEAPEIDIAVKGRRGKKGASDEKRLISFVNTIARNSPFGRAVLEDAAKDGFTLVMENQKDSCGFCDKESKIIALNPALSDSLLVATLAHESRHAQQFARGAEDAFGVFNLKGEIMYTRAMEADAETAAAATCHEIRINSGNNGPWKDFSEDSVEIANGFMAAAPSKDAPINDKMLQGAFNGWYQDVPMMEAYEDSYIVDTMRYAMKGPKDQMPDYDKDVKSEDIVKLFCSNAKGECYWADNRKVLDGRDKISISAETYNTAKTFFEVREMRTGKKPDPTLEDMDVRLDLFRQGRQAEKDGASNAFSIKGPKKSQIEARIAASVIQKKQR